MSIEDAIEELIPSLRRYALALCRQPDLADDLVQDSLERALSRLTLWRRGSNLRAWLFAIVHNTYVNGARGRYGRSATLDLADWQDRLGEGPAQAWRMEFLDVVRALGRLPDEQRHVIVLIGVEGLTYDEAARVLGVAKGTVMSRLSRGREALRRHTEGGSGTLLRQVT